ncbi:MAG: phosphatidate cytidylyltransferase [Kiritimatiellia bacterium]
MNRQQDTETTPRTLDSLIKRHKLVRRFISGIATAAALVLTAYYVPPLGTLIALLAVSALAQLEFYRIMERAGMPVFRVIGLICGSALIAATFYALGPRTAEMATAYKLEQAVLIATLIAVFLRQFPQKHNDKPLVTIGCTLFGIWYVPFLFNFFTRLAFAWDSAVSVWRIGETGRQLIFYLVVVVKLTDTGAFFTGSLIGRHKLVPRISPKKTWEGLIGGIVAGTTAGMIFCGAAGFHFGKISILPEQALALGFLLSLAGTAGDLFESLLKRASGAKDSGSVIPGMGGILDILDSLLFAAPILYIALTFFGE